MNIVSSVKSKEMLPIPILEKLVDQPDSGIHKVKDEIHVALYPHYLNNIRVGLMNYLNRQINQWHPKLNGILAAYDNLKLHHATGGMSNEESHIHLDVVANFWLFRPTVGSTLKGVVSKKSSSHLSCLVHGAFNVPCHRPVDLDPDVQWFGANIPMGKTVSFTVVKTDMSQKIPFILGHLNDDAYYENEDPLDNYVEIVDDNKSWNHIQASTVSNSKKKFEDSDSGLESTERSSKKKRKRDHLEADEEIPVTKKSKKDAAVSETKKKRIKEEHLEEESNPVPQESVEELAKEEKKRRKKERAAEREIEAQKAALLLSILPLHEQKKKDKKSKKKDKQDQLEPEFDGTIIKTELDISQSSQSHEPKRSKKDKKKDKEIKPDSDTEAEQQRNALLSALTMSSGSSKKKHKKKKDKDPRDSEEESERQKELLLQAVKVETSGKKKKKDKGQAEEESERQKELLLQAVQTATSAKKKKKEKKDDSIGMSEENTAQAKHDHLHIYNMNETAPSFMVSTSTPIQKTSELGAAENLIGSMLSRFGKKSKKAK